MLCEILAVTARLSRRHFHLAERVALRCARAQSRIKDDVVLAHYRVCWNGLARHVSSLLFSSRFSVRKQQQPACHPQQRYIGVGCYNFFIILELNIFEYLK